MVLNEGYRDECNWIWDGQGLDMGLRGGYRGRIGLNMERKEATGLSEGTGMGFEGVYQG